MKYFYLLAIFLFSGSAFAADVYSCKAADGSIAELKIKNGAKSIEWNDVNHSAISAGVFIGRETAPYSEWKGYFVYDLVDFYKTNDSSFKLALQQKAGKVDVVVFFDNDDHVESVAKYSCSR